MALKFEITGDNSNLLSSLDGAREGVRRTARDIEESGIGIEDMFKRIGAAAGIAFSLDQAKGFISKVTEIRSYFQDIESSMKVFLGNEQKASEFTDKLKDYAYYNMFEFKDLADASKQMIAYGNAVDSIIPTLDRLSNIATGTSANLSDLVNLYNRAKNLGKVGSQDLASWAVKGVVVRDVLKDMGVEADDTSVTFEQLNMVLEKVTNEGGMFHDLMKSQMSNISAEQGQLEDNLAAMYNEIGEEYQDFITGAIKAEGWLVEHYKEVGSVILGLVASYGEYQAALKVTRAIENTMAKQANGIESARQRELQDIYGKYSDNSDIIAIGEETAAEEANTAAILQNTASREGNVTAIDQQIAALERKMLSEIEDYDNIIKSSQAAIDSAKAKEDAADKEIEVLQQQVDTAKEYLEMCNEEVESANKSGDAKEIEAAKRNYNTAATEAENAEKALATAQSNKETAAEAQLTAQKNMETAASRRQATQEKLTNFQKAVGTTQTKAQTAATGLWVAMTKSATAALNSMKVALMSNPFGVALAAITTIISLLPLFSEETSNASAEIERFGESAVKQTRNLETLMAVVDNTSDESKVHNEAVDELCSIYEEYGFKIDDEIDKLQQLKDMHELVTGAIRKEGEERQKANLLQSYNDALEEATSNMRDALQTAYENAEYDGSGWFDDWDADSVRDRSKELVQIVGAIIQSEADALATLTGDELEAKIDEVNNRIEKAYKDMGVEYEKWFKKMGPGGQDLSDYFHIDVDAVQIMRDYSDAIHSVTEGRAALLKTFDEEKNAQKAVQKEIDYTTMSIEDLAKEAIKATANMSELGEQSASPDVDKSLIDDATDAAEKAKTGIDLLNDITAKPSVDTTSISLAIGETNTLLGNMFRLQNSPMFNPKVGNGGNFSLGFNPGNFGFGNQPMSFNPWNGKKPVWGTVGGKAGVQWIPDITITDPALLARQEMNNRVNAANSQKKVDDLLKEVNDAFNKATFDSDQYNFLKDLKERLEKKSRKKSGSIKGNKSNKSDKIEQEQQKLEDLQDELDIKRLRSIQDMQTRLTNQRLDLMQDGAEKVRLLQEQQNKEEIESLERQREDAIREYIEGERRLFEQKEKIKKSQNEKYKEKKFDESTVDTSSIASQYDELIELTRQNQLQGAYQQTLVAMRNYLKEYGTIEQQRLAITQEYEQKIAEALSPTERASIMLERNKALKDFDAKQFEEQIDWSGVFSDLQGHTKDYLIGLRDQLQGVLKEGMLEPDQLAVVQEKLRDINAEISKQNGLFQFIGDRSREHARLVQEAADAQSALTQSKKEEADAQQNVLDITSSIRGLLEGVGISSDVDLDDELLSQFDANSDEYKQMARLLETLRIGEANLAKARRETEKATRQAKNAEDAKKRESAQAIADWFSDAQQFISEKGIDQIPDLLSELGLGKAGEKVQLGLDAFNSGAKAAEDFASGNYIGAALNGLSAFKSVGELLGIGGSSDKTLEEDIERLTASNEALKYSIDELSDKMSESSVANAEAIYKQQIDQLAQSEKNTQEMMSRSASAYSNGFLGIGGSHSSSKKINDGVSSSEWNRISQLLGKSVRSAGDFFNLTSEQMYKVAVELPDIYAHIKDLANDGYKDAAQFMDQYLEYAKQREELENAYREKLTSISFDSVQNDFSNMLMDMDSDADTFADNFEKYMQRAIINSLVSDQYKPLLENWYKAFASYMTDGMISEEEMRKLRESGGSYYDETTGKYQSFQSWESISNSALAARDALKNMFGWTDSESSYKQEASSKGFNAMSQDVGSELNGRFTALQIAGESVAAQAISIYSQMLLMSQTQISSNTYLLEMRNMMVLSNSYLEDISKYSKKIYLDFTTKLDDIVTNTKQL